MGGAEKELWQLLKWLPKNEFECHCLFSSDGPMVEKVKALGIKIHIAKLKWWVANNEDPMICLFNVCDGIKERIEKISDIIKSNDIDLVMTNTIVVPDGAMAAKMTGVPHIWRIAEMLSSDPSLKPFLSLRSLYSSVIRLSDYVVVCANAVMAEFKNTLGYKPDNMRVVYSAMETNEGVQENKLKVEDENIVFSAGYISPRKDFFTLLKAAKLVHDRIPSVRFKIAGSVSDGDYYKKLLRERKALKLESIFELCGFRNDIEKLINQSAVFALSSTSEPFGVVLLEAMGAAKPMVVTDSGGPSEAVVDGVNGYVVPVKDYKKMADRIIFLLNNKDIAKRMGQAGCRRTKAIFNMDIFGNNYVSLFKKAVKTQRKRSAERIFQMEDIIELFNDIGTNRKFIRDRINSYDKIYSSFPYRLYKKVFKTSHE